MEKKVNEAFDFIRKKFDGRINTGIILGTGLGGLVKYIHQTGSIDYSEIPHFPISTVESHSGKLIFGNLSDHNIIAMQGRFHFYEGYSHDRVTFPVKVMKKVGIRNLIVSNACGAINPKFNRTDLMIMTSHINLHFTSPLIGNNYSVNGEAKYFYDKNLVNLAFETALENNIPVKKGSYASVQGPNLETRAEYRMIKKIGADVVGMSTIPEVLVAKKLGIRVLGLSIITDEGFPDTLKVAKLEHILEAAGKAEPNLVKLIQKIVEKI